MADRVRLRHKKKPPQNPCSEAVVLIRLSMACNRHDVIYWSIAVEVYFTSKIDCVRRTKPVLPIRW